jgi:Phospholipase B
MRTLSPLAALVLTLASAPALLAADFQPDPRTVMRSGPAYRYPQAGWIVLHIEGEPYERGIQHGRLLAPEIADFVRTFAYIQSSKDPSAGWKLTRHLCNALFVRGYTKEYLEEMKGIADGAAAAGARFDDRPLDLIDIVCLNALLEVETLPSALEAAPIGLEGIRFPKPAPQPAPTRKPMHCSAFVATGPATRDGKVILGHITMSGLATAYHSNVWLDVKPTKGHRVLMQTFPGGIQSGMDYYLNDAGIICCETTLAQTKFDAKGAPVASRIREAMQYGDSIDKVVEILGKANNGLYTNEWLLADTKTNEIAMYELGTAKSRLWRSSKNEWIGDTPGFYWGCNNTKDLDVRLETMASVDEQPGKTLFVPSERDKVWLRLYDRHKGKIDDDFGKLAFTTPILTAYSSLDAKFATADMVKDLKTWALWGPPLGRTWKPTDKEKADHPGIRPLVSNPWTVLHPGIPGDPGAAADRIVDLHDPKTGKSRLDLASADERRTRRHTATLPAWHGSLLPSTDVDLWLVSSYPTYQGWAAHDNTLRESGKELTARQRDQLGVALFAERSLYELGARAREEVALEKLKPDFRQNDWDKIGQGKGVLLLHTLREKLGTDKFDALMDKFGSRAHPRVNHVATLRGLLAERAPGSEVILDEWVKSQGLPKLKISHVAQPPSKDNTVTVSLTQESGPPLAIVPVTVETSKGEVTGEVEMKDRIGTIKLHCDSPRRVIVDKYGLAAHANGGPFAVTTFTHEIEQALIVYGTADEQSAHREAAELLQEALRHRGPNVTIPIKSDREVTDAELKEAHVLLIGRPACNPLTKKWAKSFPISFGQASVQVRGEVLAHPLSAVVAAGENPLNRRFSTVVIAGLSAESMYHAATLLGSRTFPAGEVVTVPAGGKRHALVVPAPELVRDLGEVRAATR